MHTIVSTVCRDMHSRLNCVTFMPASRNHAVSLHRRTQLLSGLTMAAILRCLPCFDWLSGLRQARTPMAGLEQKDSRRSQDEFAVHSTDPRDFRAPPPAPWSDGKLGSLRSPCCGLAICDAFCQNGA
ncbi:hypothetical protein PoB_001093500 [Plakobranchus ocellatus]|uniref:Uncharacterized protein n=1 Tax=Plakobranchus ocellatus TaxID=259542 RepID=A0AAV3YPQ7_9GAST|nr:hypothetical protein PoB_001093500 [Plakobranchus ocellatus]